MTPAICPGLARRLDAAAFAFAMLGFCWWLHAAIVLFGWLSRRQAHLPSAVLAVEAFAVLLIALGVPVLAGRRVFQLVRGVLRGIARLVLLLDRRPRRPGSVPAARRPASGGVR